MNAIGRYDSELQMFISAPAELNIARVTFLRWLAENGRLEHDIASDPRGDLVLVVRAAQTGIEVTT